MAVVNETLDAWHARLVLLACSRDLEWLISLSPEDHTDGYNEGYSIQEELAEQIDACY